MDSPGWMPLLLLALGTLLSGYLAGSLPSAYLVARWARGIDIRSVGSRNMGAVNTCRHVGPRGGVAVLLLDAAKGAGTVAIIQGVGLGDAAIVAGALGAVVGHNWPVFLGFRGGKGMAVVFGISIAMLPLWTVVSLAATLGSGLATRSVVFGVGTGVIVLNALTIVTGQDMTQIALCLVLSAIVIATHYAMAWRDIAAAWPERGAWALFSGE